MEDARRVEIEPRGPYSLAASTRFLEGFAPAAYEGAGDHLHLAFPDSEGEPAGVCLRAEGDAVAGEVFGVGDVGWARAETERILSLDADGRGFAAVGERDAVVGGLQRRLPGLRPVLFNSPYEAGAWALIGHRVRIVQAARTKARMAEQLGRPIDIHGDVRFAFPAPARLTGLEAFPGLFGRKAEWLRALAVAAQDGLLGAARLRALAPAQALSELTELPGIGPFSAELILLRGAGEPDRVPSADRRLRRAVALAYRLGEEPSQRELDQLAEGWRPYRTWVSVLLRSFLEEETGEIAGPGA